MSLLMPYHSRRDDTWRARRDAAASAGVEGRMREGSRFSTSPVVVVTRPREARAVPGPLAPAHCVTVESGHISPDHVVLVGRDLQGVVHVRVELSRADASSWWGHAIRSWLAWRHGASEIRILRNG